MKLTEDEIYFKIFLYFLFSINSNHFNINTMDVYELIYIECLRLGK